MPWFHCAASVVKIAAAGVSLIFLGIVLGGALRTVLERHWLFFRKLDGETRYAYAVLAIAAIALLAWSSLPDLRIESLDIAGVKATVGNLQQQVATLSEQMEAFFQRKKIEVFDQHNWDRVRKVGKNGNGVLLEVTLEQEPILGSIEVYEGVLEMPEQQYHVEGRVVRFPANTDKPLDGLTIKYYPRLKH